jgi:hypothetical protein
MGSYTEHAYSLPPRKARVISRRVRLKASEESESTQSSIASSSHSNYSQESQSSAASTRSAPSEASEQSYLSDDDHLRRSSRKGRGVNDKWSAYRESDEDLRRVSLGLRNKNRSSGRRYLDSPIKTRSRNSGKERVRYTYDDDDYEYDNNSTHLNETVSSRGRVRKFKAHARFATH